MRFLLLLLLLLTTAVVKSQNEIEILERVRAYCQRRSIEEEKESAIAFIEQTAAAENDEKKKSLFQSCQSGDGDISALHKVALHYLLPDPSTTVNGIELLKYLVDSSNHISSMASLGKYYYDNKNLTSSLQYYELAANYGHHPSMYNVGRILAELEPRPDYVGALAYIRAAAVFDDDEKLSANIQKVATKAYELLSQQISRISDLSIQEMADIFLYGSLENLNEQVEELWTKGVMGLYNFNQTFVESTGSNQDRESMEIVTHNLMTILENYSTTTSDAPLSLLQKYFVLDNLNDMLGPLSGLDDFYLKFAASYAEALALSPYCYNQYATKEDQPACFNGAAASAISYFRRLGLHDDAERIVKLGRNHDFAATSWKYQKQTPRVYHSELESKPWWNSSDFSASTKLTNIYRNNKSRKVLLGELQKVKKLQEGRLRGDHDENLNLQRIFTPYIGVRTEEEETSIEGAGGWAEFGPLFNGLEWNVDNCNLVPTICDALRNDPSLCSARVTREQIVNGTHTVSELCGAADAVVTILRLRPGTTILPHCGTTNARLIMHFALEGASGVEFTVGEEMVKSYGNGDGSAIVFDDSFEHYVHHGGDRDRFIVLAVLSHPELLKNSS